MIDLKLHISPFGKNIIIPVDEKVYFRILNLIGKNKHGREFYKFEIPEFGYRGMELQYMDMLSIYSYEDLILFNNSNITEFLRDPGKRINNLFLKIALKNNYRVLNYFLEVRNFNLKEKKHFSVNLNNKKEQRKNV